MSSPKPHVVLLHGAWHSPTYFAKITALLQDHLYMVHSTQLPAVGKPPLWTPPTDLSQDIAAARALLDDAIGSNGNDVIVICHSWGGTIAGSALVGYGKEERVEQGLKGGVVKCGYMCAFMVNEGVGSQGEHPPWCDINPPYINAKDPDIFYNDLPKDERAYWHQQLQTHSLATWRAPTGASWKTIPSSYLLCENDRALPPQAQEAMIDAAKETGANVEVVRLDSGHSPFLSRPKETVAWIRRVAGEKL